MQVDKIFADTVFIAEVLLVQPERGHVFVKYQDLIQEAYSWLRHDEKLQSSAAMNLSPVGQRTIMVLVLEHYSCNLWALCA